MAIVFSGAGPANIYGVIGQEYDKLLYVSNGVKPYSISIISGSLPPGLSINPAPYLAFFPPPDYFRFVVYGIPTTSGIFSAICRVSDSVGSFTDGTVAITITSQQNAQMLIPSLHIGQPYRFSLTNDFAIAGLTALLYPPGSTHAPYTYGTPVSAFGNTLATWGLTFSGNTLSATSIVDPFHSGIGDIFHIPVTDSSAPPKNASGSLAPLISFDIWTPPLTIICPSSIATLGVFYSQLFSINGGVGPFSFSLISGSLPPGMVLNSLTGLISGTPFQEGTFHYTVKVIDSAGIIATASC